MILVTLVFSSLLVSIWFYSSRSTQCCADLRSVIDLGAGQVCGAPPAPPPMSPMPLSTLPPLSVGMNQTASCLDEGNEPMGCPPVGPCLGYDGNCADLLDQFATIPGCYVYGEPGAEEEHEFLDDFVCHAFPDDSYVTDQFFVGLSACTGALARLQVHPNNAGFFCVAQLASPSRCL